MEDPDWLVKKKAGKKLDPIEVEQFFKHKFEEEHAILIKESFESIPNDGQLNTIINDYHLFKKTCLMSFYNC